MQIHKHICPRPNIGDEINDWFWFETIGAELKSVEPDKLLVGIGTVLSNKLPQDKKKYVLGSGTGYDNEGFALPSSEYNVYFVRGPLTAAKFNLPDSKWITDPGILISELRPYAGERDIPVSFMPHVGIDSEDYRNLVEEMGINYISPSDDENLVLAQIARSKRFITSAMHGAIFADSYRTPWSPVVTSNEILDFKWKDWTLSVGVAYQPQFVPAYWGRGGSAISKLKAYIKKLIIQKKLKKIAANQSLFVNSSDSVFLAKCNAIKEQFMLFRKDVL